MIALLLIALTTADDAYARGMHYFEQAMFEQAVAPLKEALAAKLTASEVKNARLALAQACFYTNDKACARGQIEKLRRTNVTVDTKLLPPDFVAFFDSVAPALPAPAPAPEVPPPVVQTKPTKKKPTEKPTERPAEKPVVKAVPSKPVSDAPVVAQTPVPEVTPEPEVAPTPVAAAPRVVPWYLRMLPLGIGHFIQGDAAFGAIFLTLELGAIAANVALAAINERRVLADGRLPGDPQSARLYWAQQGTAIAAYAIFALGFIDGLFLAPLRQKPAAITITPGPGAGIGAAGVF